MGAYRAGADPIVDVAVARHDHILEFISQGQKDRVDYVDLIQALLEAFGA